MSIDEMLGEDPIEARLQQSLRRNKGAQAVATDSLAAEEFVRPVSAAFLAKVFGMSPATVTKRLANCNVVATKPRGNGHVHYYDFKESCGFLIAPQVDIAEWIKSQRVQDLPTHISDQYWKAMRTKQSYLREAGELWRTEDVLEVFGDLFMSIKERTQLWIEELPGKASMSTAQYETFQRLVAAMQEDIYDRLVRMPKEKRTPHEQERVLEETKDDALLPPHEAEA
jgi:hypothetical protein